MHSDKLMQKMFLHPAILTLWSEKVTDKTDGTD